MDGKREGVMEKCRQCISGEDGGYHETSSDRSRYKPREFGLFLLLFSSKGAGARPNPMPEAQNLFRRNSALLRSPGWVNASALCRGLAYALSEQWCAAVLCTGKGLTPFRCLWQLSPTSFDCVFVFAYMVEAGNYPCHVFT